MYTRCPGCHTVHPVNAPLLAQEHGKYRCGKCKQINNALEALFDEWPEPGDQPPVAGKLPVLGTQLDLEAAKQTRLEPGETSYSSEEEVVENQGKGRNKKLVRAAWITTAIAILILVTVYLAEFFQYPLMESSSIKDMLTRTGQKDGSLSTPFRNLNQIQLLSRDMRSHPDRPDALNLSLTIVNRAARSQPFPELEVTLTDSVGQTLTKRLFHPNEYLPDDADIKAGMSPEAYLHISLELADPGHQAVGFELNFR